MNTTPALARLQKYRAIANDWRQKNPSYYKCFHDWRAHAKGQFNKAPKFGRITDRPGEFWADDVHSFPGTYLGDAHDIARLKHHGWYTDNSQDGLAIGGVIKLSTSRGSYYIPTVRETDCDGVSVYLCDAEFVAKGDCEAATAEAIRDAASTADHNAERRAELRREDDAKFQAEQQIEQAREEIHTLNQEALGVLAELKELTLPPNTCALLKKTLGNLLKQRKRLFKRIDELTSNPWAAVSN